MSAGAERSTRVELEIVTVRSPRGQVLVPAGTFDMGDHLGDGDPAARAADLVAAADVDWS